MAHSVRENRLVSLFGEKRRMGRFSEIDLTESFLLLGAKASNRMPCEIF